MKIDITWKRYVHGGIKYLKYTFRPKKCMLHDIPVPWERKVLDTAPTYSYLISKLREKNIFSLLLYRAVGKRNKTKITLAKMIFSYLSEILCFNARHNNHVKICIPPNTFIHVLYLQYCETTSYFDPRALWKISCPPFTIHRWMRSSMREYISLSQ